MIADAKLAFARRIAKTVALPCLFFASASAATDLKHPDWHPDNVTLISEGSCDGGIDLYLIDTVSGRVQRLHDGEYTDGYPRWFADGKRIAFHEIDDERNARIFMATVSDNSLTELRPMSNGPFDIEPAPSPDGLFIAFSRPGNRGLNIALLEVASRKLLQVWPSERGEHFPSWHPTGDALIYHTPFGDSVEIMQREIQSGATAALTAAPGPNVTGHLNATATKLVYASERDDDREIYLRDLETGTDVRITRTPGRDGYPRFSADGRKIAFHSESGARGTSIRVVDLLSGDTRDYQCRADH